MIKGFVALVGAGPGDIGLLTLKGMEYIKRADVVVYDRLVSDEILQLASFESKKINVGKEPKKHLVPQNEINTILLNHALEGKLVVRVKGGDPFVFGRGAEELELLRENDVPFEVVPGITTAISVPAYAGIPVTHRDFSSSVHVITGNKKNNGQLELDFNLLASIGGTLVFLMSVSSLKQILDGLLNAGMDKNMPASIIENGTTPYQRKVVGTIENLFDKAQNKKIKAPSIVVVGEVCRFSQKLDWFSNRELSGTNIIVTRPKASGGTLSLKLKELGANVIDYPCVEINQISPNSLLKSVLEKISDYNWLVFTSKNGVSIFFDYMKNQKKDARLLSDIKIAAVGKQTAQTLSDYGIIADYVPDVYAGTNLAEGLCKLTGENEKILITRARDGNNEILDILKKNGRQYEDVPIYVTNYTNLQSQKIKSIINENPDLYVTFTSASTVEGFVKTGQESELNNIIGICIGSQTAKLAEKYGINHYVAKEATIDSMIETIRKLENENNK